jgi:hypothetical protein
MSRDEKKPARPRIFSYPPRIHIQIYLTKERPIWTAYNSRYITVTNKLVCAKDAQVPEDHFDRTKNGQKVEKRPKNTRAWDRTRDLLRYHAEKNTIGIDLLKM